MLNEDTPEKDQLVAKKESPESKKEEELEEHEEEHGRENEGFFKIFCLI